MSVDLAGSIALVTGATRGIGRDIAIGLGRRGATVIGTGTTAEGAKNIERMLAEHNIAGAGVALDVNDPDMVIDTVERINTSIGAPLVLVNNAGITKDDLLLRMKEAQWNDVLNTNLTSVYRLTKACLRGMTKARKGRIINISSVVGVMGNAGQSNYAAAKAGMIGFSKSLAQEVAARNITVNAITPGFIDTDMTQSLPEETRNQITSQIPLRRLGTGKDIANAVAFLASDEASYITGATLHVNGGMYMS